MKLVHRRCAGLDVHKTEVVACLRLGGKGEAKAEIRRFSTITHSLMELGDWLESAGCTHVAMEATGVYWKPVWHLLGDRFELVLANAAHVKNVPGRKSDVSDAGWIADLLAHGLIRSSFVPPAPIQELRELTRTRRQLGREVVRHVQRIQAVLETANIKLASVVSEVLGVSGRRILMALIAGESDPEKLAALGESRLHCSRARLIEALHGRVTEHHRFMLRQHLRTIEHLEQTMREFDIRIEEKLRPFRSDVERLKQVPGLAGISVPAILAEIGTDMSRFPTHGHLLSWATVCPRLDESAGKSRCTRVRKGGTWLKPLMVQCAWVAVRTDSYYRAQYQRLRARRGAKKAIVAVAASMLTTIYYMLRDRSEYRELGADHFDRQNMARTVARLTARLEKLGYKVDIRTAA